MGGAQFGAVSEASLSDTGLRNLKKTKLSLNTLIVGTFLRCLFGDLNILPEVIQIFMGIFLLRTDAQMLQAYRFLSNTMCRVCCGDGGLRLVLPFCVISCVNGFFSFLYLLMLGTIFLKIAYLIIAMGCFSGSYFTYMIWKEITPMEDLEGGFMAPGPGQLNRPLMGGNNNQGGQQSAPQQQSFVMFGGQGQTIA